MPRRPEHSARLPQISAWEAPKNECQLVIVFFFGFFGLASPFLVLYILHITDQMSAFDEFNNKRPLEGDDEFR
ncbi:hypothetical protein D3C72_1963150 [compost metagenome]